MKRRQFLSKAGVAAAGAGSLLAAPSVARAQQQFNWRMATSWPPALTILDGAARRIAKQCETMSGGRIKIQVYAAGELMPAFGVLDACQQGTIQMAHSFPGYWTGKIPSASWFSSVPFGLNAQGMNIWMYTGGGLQLWEEAYRPFDVIPRPAGHGGVNAAGWYRRKINSVADYKGLKIRSSGLSSKVYAKMGAATSLIPGGEVYAALERGVLDAVEWQGPFDDLKLGLHNAAKYYYFPGVNKPTGGVELMVGRKAWDSLPADLRAVVDSAAAEVNQWVLLQYYDNNMRALNEIFTKHKGKVEVNMLPDVVLREQKKIALDVLDEEAAKDPMARKVHEAFQKFKAQLGEWSKYSEGAWYRADAL